MNFKLDAIMGIGVKDSISDVYDMLEEIKKLMSSTDICDKLDEIRGIGHNVGSLAEVCDLLDEIKGYKVDGSLSDICDKLESLEEAITTSEDY